MAYKEEDVLSKNQYVTILEAGSLPYHLIYLLKPNPPTVNQSCANIGISVVTAIIKEIVNMECHTAPPPLSRT